MLHHRSRAAFSLAVTPEKQPKACKLGVVVFLQLWFLGGLLRFDAPCVFLLPVFWEWKQLLQWESDGLEAERSEECDRGADGGEQGSFCCERSESPAGGAAWTICQKLGVYFSGQLSSSRLNTPRDKSFTLTPPPFWFTQHASGFSCPQTAAYYFSSFLSFLSFNRDNCSSSLVQ